ncbi:MAG: nuclease [Mariprofundaceae bacterium]|nr:nuclease [Mariprofundaceae bacterium]
MQLIRALLLVSLLLASQIGWAGTFSQIGSSRWVSVAKVYDGDTFKTDDGEKVRLLGINTPEIAHSSKPGEVLGRRAKSRLEELIGNRLVRLEFDREKRDKYGRLLAHVRLRDGRWINSQMIQDGLAHLYIFAPNFRYAGKLLEDEKAARLKRSGIWGKSRFKVIKKANVTPSMIGQFRLVEGSITHIGKSGWKIKMGSLLVTIPRAYREWFKSPPKLKVGQQIVVRGKIRISRKDRLYLALHSPFDLEIIER